MALVESVERCEALTCALVHHSTFSRELSWVGWGGLGAGAEHNNSLLSPLSVCWFSRELIIRRFVCSHRVSMSELLTKWEDCVCNCGLSTAISASLSPLIAAMHTTWLDGIDCLVCGVLRCDVALLPPESIIQFATSSQTRLLEPLQRTERTGAKCVRWAQCCWTRRWHGPLCKACVRAHDTIHDSSCK